MDWIVNNPISDLYGPYFLGLYAFLCALAAGICFWHRSKQDRSDSLPPLRIPDSVDPYRIAYLRGGVSEVIRLGTLELMHRGFLQEIQTGKDVGKVQILNPYTETNSPVLTTLANYYDIPRKPTDVFQGNMPQRLTDAVAPAEGWVESEQLKFTPDARRAHNAFRWVLLLSLVGFGFYKMMVALSHHHNNIIFLVLMMTICPILVMISTNLPRYTKRGKRFLEDLQSANQDFKKLIHYSDTGNFAQGDMVPMMAMGIFGVAALEATSYSYLYDNYRRSASLGSSCGSGCGSGSSCGGATSCGGAAASCSGGAASCGGGGGGGCGGGGCGGCGGGS